MLGRARLATEQAVSVVLDVGANEGLFARRLRTDGYRGRIVSFEPLSHAFALLALASANDTNWECLELALGRSAGRKSLNVAENWASSSFLPMEQSLQKAEPRFAYIGMQDSTVAALDDLAGDLLQPDDRVYLKLDVQGFELEVLRGAEQTLDRVVALDVELSQTELYTGAPLMGDVVGHLADRGFELVGTEPAYRHPKTRETLQLDGVFVRT